MADEIQRITEAALPNWVYMQAQRVKITYQHMIDMQEGLRQAINKNFRDIKRMFNGELSFGNATSLQGAILSTYNNEILQDDDGKVPTSKQVFNA